MIAGTLTPPSSQENLPPLNGAADPGPLGGTTGPLSLDEDDERVLVEPGVTQPLHHLADRGVELLDHVAVGPRRGAPGVLGAG